MLSQSFSPFASRYLYAVNKKIINAVIVLMAIVVTAILVIQFVWIKKAIELKGKTIIPLKLYFKNRRAKLEIGICRGKDQKDKRQDVLKREANLEMARQIKKHQ